MERLPPVNQALASPTAPQRVYWERYDTPHVLGRILSSTAGLGMSPGASSAARQKLKWHDVAACTTAACPAVRPNSEDEQAQVRRAEGKRARGASFCVGGGVQPVMQNSPQREVTVHQCGLLTGCEF